MQQLINLALQYPLIKKPITPKYKSVLIAINDTGSKFTLSNIAMEHIKNEIDQTIIIDDDYNNHLLPGHIMRDDPKLIKIIESLEQRASGFESNIVVKQYYLPYNCTFKINGSFGKEMVFAVPYQ